MLVHARTLGSVPVPQKRKEGREEEIRKTLGKKKIKGA